MSKTYFARLFDNANEGESKGPIIGHLPEWFLTQRTRIIYNGPVGIWDHSKQTVNNWFDGMAMLTAFKIDGAAKMVHLQKKFLRSEAYEKAKSHGKVIITEYGTAGTSDPDKGMISKLMSSLIPGEMTDNCACNVIEIGGGLACTTETCLMRRLDPDTLESPELIDLSGLVNIASGRSLTDPQSKMVYNLSGTFLTGLKYHFISFPPSDVFLKPEELLSSARIVATIPSRMTTCFSYYHSFGMTENYLIMIEQPWVANSIKLAASKIKGLTFYECLDWYAKEKNLFHIVSKDTGKPIVAKLKIISSSSFFFLNFINCFEDHDENVIVIDLIAYDSPNILDQLFLDKLRSGKFDVKDKSKVMRFVVPLLTIEAKLEAAEDYYSKTTAASAVWDRKKGQLVLSPHQVSPEQGCEHPSINRLFTGRQANFVYVIGWMESVNRGFFANAVTKIHLGNGKCLSWRGEEFCHPMEAIFVPRIRNNSSHPLDSASEDDGLIVSSVTDTRQDHQDFLLFLDAKSMSEVARVHFDERIPFGSHGYLGQY